MMEKALPHSIEAEEGVLGSILIDPEAIDLVADFLRADDFYSDVHRTIYQCMLSLHSIHSPPDYITLCDELARRGNAHVKPSYLSGLVSVVPTSAHIEYYGRIVAKASTHRKLIHVAGRIAALAYEQSEEALGQSEDLLYQISQGKSAAAVSSLADVMGRYMRKLDSIHEQRRKGVVTGVPTGFKGLDTILGGLQPSDLIVLAARPALGKTSFALNIAAQIMEYSTTKGHHVLMFSLEMGEEQLARRLLSMEATVDQARLRTADIGEEEWERLTEAAGRLSEGKMWIDDTPGLSLTDMRSRARRIQSAHRLDLIIVDYLQLMKAGTSVRQSIENRVQEVSLISRGLKELARELRVPVLALAQLNRAVESRLGNVPQLSDLKNSGDIEQDSDVVMFIHCDEKDEQQKKQSEPYWVNILIAKHRNGPTGMVKLRFEPRLTKFYSVLEREVSRV